MIVISDEFLWSDIYVTKAKEPAPVQVTFYTKAGCHLCEEARDMLDDIAALTAYELTEIDIRGNPDIFEKYRYRIPVIIVNSDTLLEGRIEFRDLAKAFHLLQYPQSGSSTGG